MAISNLLSKIKENTEKEAKVILDKANNEAKEIIHKRVDIEAANERKKILEKAERESISRVERIDSSAKLKVRNDILEAKQKMIQKVFDLSLSKLENLSLEELTGLIKKTILNSSLQGEVELILSNEYRKKIKPEFINELNSELKNKNHNVNVKMNTSVSNIDSGFILSQKGIEINYTFKALVSSLKEEMEYEINEILFRN